MNTQKTRWATMAGLIIAGAAMASAGCGSSSSSSGTGGTSGGSGGTSGGTGGATVIHKISYTFDADKQGWILGTYADPSSVNLAGNYATADGGTDAGSTDGGITGTTSPVLEWDSVIGNPSAGSLKLTATFTAYGQYVDAIFQTLMPTVDLHTGQLHGKLQITSVSTSSFMGGAQLHASTGTDYSGYAKADFVLAPMGSFATATIDMSTQVAPVDPTVVIQLGIQIFTGTLLPAGTPLLAPQTVVFNLDTVTD